MPFTFPSDTTGHVGAVREDGGNQFHVPTKLYKADGVTVIGDTEPVTVSGTRADGVAGGDDPVVIGGTDGTNTRTLRTTSAGQLIVDARISQAFPGTSNFIEARLNTRRGTGILHRDSRTGVDKLAVPTVTGRTGVTVGGGSLAAGTTYNCTVAASNRWGTTTVATVAGVAPGGTNNAIRLAWNAVSGADRYDLFLSTDAAPKWVASVTEAQRAAGGIITTVGQASPTAGGTAGSISIGVVGTELASDALPFRNNTAYVPTSVTPLNCNGYQYVHVLAKFSLTDLRAQPSVTLVPFVLNSVTGTDWHQGAPVALPFLTGRGTALCQEFYLAVNGSTGLVLLVDELVGNGALSVWLQLV